MEMFNAIETVIKGFVEELSHEFLRAFPNGDQRIAEVLEHIGRLALETIANTDALYHDVRHTMLATQAGEAILQGRQQSCGDVSASTWLHTIASLLFHDIGYVRGICRADRTSCYVIDLGGKTLEPPPGSTDAFMTPFHVDRSMIFVRERFAGHDLIDPDIVCMNVERTRFPVPDDPAYRPVDDYPGLVRAADLIGQLGDPHYFQKLPGLFHEFTEAGYAKSFGYANMAELRARYPRFFSDVVQGYIAEGVRYLRRTQAGQVWLAQLYANVFTEEHDEPSYGPERLRVSNPAAVGDKSPETEEEPSIRRPRIASGPAG